jgi:hypothetical protein
MQEASIPDVGEYSVLSGNDNRRKMGSSQNFNFGMHGFHAGSGKEADSQFQKSGRVAGLFFPCPNCGAGWQNCKRALWKSVALYAKKVQTSIPALINRALKLDLMDCQTVIAWQSLPVRPSFSPVVRPVPAAVLPSLFCSSGQ